MVVVLDPGVVVDTFIEIVEVDVADEFAGTLTLLVVVNVLKFAPEVVIVIVIVNVTAPPVVVFREMPPLLPLKVLLLEVSVVDGALVVGPG